MNYVSLKINFWADPDVLELTPEQKAFYIYLLTNPRINQIGCYEFSKKYAAFETGFNVDTIEKLLAHFEEIGKLKRSEIGDEIALVNFFKHNATASPKLVTYCRKLVAQVKDKSLLPFIKEIEKVGLKVADTVSIPYLQQEQEQEEEKEEEQQQQQSAVAASFDFFASKNKILAINHNGKKKRIGNGWQMLHEEFEIERAVLQRYIDLEVPSMAVLNIVKKARKGTSPSGLALHLLAELSGNHKPAAPKVAEPQRNTPNRDDSYHEPHNS